MPLPDLGPHLTRLRQADPWSRTAVAALAVYAVVIVLVFQEYGVTTDEDNRISKGAAVITWYTAPFQDPTLSWMNLWLYGGAYDAPVALLTRISPLDLYDTRHLCNAVVGFLGAVAAYRFGALLSGPLGGCLAAFFLVLTPRYFGHAFNNPKDIPFAVGYLWSLYLLAAYLPRLPRRPLTDLLKLGLAIGLTMGTRVHGVVLLAYVGLFTCVRHVLERRGNDGPSLAATGARVLLVAACAWIVMLAFWPWAQLSPLLNPLRAITEFSHFGDIHVNLFEGSYVKSSEVPWHYGLRWLAITSPEHVLLGLALLPVAWYRSRLDDLGLRRAVLAIGALFPLGYSALSEAALYNGLRHLLFAAVPLVVAAGIATADAAHKLRRRRLLLLVPVAVLLATTLAEMVSLHPHQVTYFNLILAGGVRGAEGQYDLDYYGNSYRAGVDWAQRNLDVGGRKLRIAGGSGSLAHLIDPAQAEVVDDPWRADAYVITGYQEKWRLLPGRVLHTEAAHGVPLLYVLRPDSARAGEAQFQDPPHAFHLRYRARRLKAWGRPKEALRWFEAAVALDPIDAALRVELATLALQNGDHETAATHLATALELSPSNTEALALRGAIHESQGQIDAAIQLHERALTNHPYHLLSLRSLARLYADLGRREEAAALFRRLARMQPEAAYLAYHRLGLNLREKGAYESAAWAFAQALEVDIDSPKTALHLELARALAEAGSHETAIEEYRALLAVDPQLPLIHYRLGILLLQTHDLQTAAEHLRSATRLDSTKAVHWLALAATMEKLGDTTSAAAAYRAALGLDPGNRVATAGLDRTRGGVAPDPGR